MRSLVAFLAGGAVVAGSLVGGVWPAHAASTPPWEPDPNAVARISFFDASGNQVTSGRAAARPMAAYAVASRTIETGDDTAILFAALPDTTEDPANWTREQLSAATSYPAAGAPASIGSRPTVTGSPGDESLATFAAHFPSRSGIYQIRIRTYDSANNASRPQYAAADVLVRGGSWTEVYPRNATRPLAFTITKRPALSGHRKVGSLERCSSGSWTPKPSSFSYQWFKGRSKVPGATRPDLRPTKALRHRRIHCTVTAHRSGVKDASAASKSVRIRR